LEVLKDMLKELKAAPLKPQQRIYFLINNVVTKVMYLLVNGRVHKHTLVEADRRIRNFVREVLRLPDDTPIAYFHADVSDGGLGINSMLTNVPYQKTIKFQKLLTCFDPVITAVANLPVWRNKFHMDRGIKRFQSNKDIKQYWCDELTKSADGAGLREARDCKQVHRWVNSGTSIMTGEMFIKCVKIRGNLWPTAARSSRGRSEVPMCDAGCRKIQGLAHILQQCDRTHDKRGDRHNKVLDYIAGKLQCRGYKTVAEPSIATAEGIRRPDLVVAKEDEGWVVDVTICADGGTGNLNNAATNKYNYYNKDEIRTWVMTALQIRKVNVIAIALNWRGCMTRKTFNNLRKWGFTTNEIELISIMCLEGGVYCAETYHKRTTRN
jgi:hypothetical protein